MVIGNALYVDEADQPCLVDRGTYRTGLCYGEAESLRHIDAYWAYVHAVPQPTVLFRRRLLEAHGGLSESYQSIFDLDLFLRFAANAKIGKLERTQALCRVTTAGRTGAARAELYRFSRRFWPPAPSRAFWATWRAFVAQYVRDHYGHGLGEKRLWPIAAAVAAASLVGMGNPETWRCARRRFTPPDER
jgi:hypothetical protein